MLNSYKTVYCGREISVEIKKSRFIAEAFSAGSEEEAEKIVESIRKKYWDASHHCFAYVLGESGAFVHFSDDGEPGGTAGRPILEVLTGKELRDTVIVVTRYFGGTLLGTGGLSRAYGGAAREAAEEAVIITKQRGVTIEAETDYNSFGWIQHTLAEHGFPILASKYTDKVVLTILAPADEKEAAAALLVNGTSGRISLKEGLETWFAEANGEIKLFDK